jgi:hypothetical protein
MDDPERNPGLERVQRQLRADGIRHTNNQLRSGIHSRGYLPHVKREGIRRYIRNNPVTAGLCASPEDWRWGSAWPGPADGAQAD